MARYMDYILVKHAEAFARLRSKIRSLRSNQVFPESSGFVIVDTTRTVSPRFNLIIVSPLLACRSILRCMLDFVLENICRLGSYLYEIICDVWHKLRKQFNRGFAISSECLSLILHKIEGLDSAVGPAIMKLMDLRCVLIRILKVSNVPKAKSLVNKALVYVDLVLFFLGLIQRFSVLLKEPQGSKLALCC